jgi:hypothetical protein
MSSRIPSSNSASNNENPNPKLDPVNKEWFDNRFNALKDVQKAIENLAIMADDPDSRIEGHQVAAILMPISYRFLDIMGEVEDTIRF